MGLLRIRVFPDPVLRKRARPIKVVDDGVRKLARDMVETMQAAPGIGLAANQVGVLKRLIVLQMPEEDPAVMVNPEVTHREGERDVQEGCLSFPGYSGMVRRSVTIRARALDEWGGKVRLTAAELLAQVVEHEVDHLNGILFPDHLLEHEKVHLATPPDRGADEAGPDHSGPHSHDVRLDLVVDHETRLPPALYEGSGVELLAVNLKLAGLTSDASLADLAYEVTSPRGADPVRTRAFRDLPHDHSRAR